MAVDKSKTVSFFHGPKASIQGKINDNTITPADLVITSDSDELVYIDADKSQHTLGNAKSKQEWEVNLGAGGTVGGLKTGDTIEIGTDLDALIKLLTQKSVPATYTQPAVACRVSSGTSAGSYEVGTSITANIQGTFTQNDAGALTNIKIMKGAEEVISQGTSPVTAENQTFTLGDETVSFTAVATYAEGTIKNDNLGQPSPDGHIQAGSKTSSAVSFVGKRNLFYGSGTGNLPEVTSELVRGLANKKLGPANGNAFNITVPVGDQYIVIAYPATLRNMTKCFYVEQNTDLVENFKQTTISVQGANGAAGADYKVYTMGLSVPAAAALTLQVTI